MIGALILRLVAGVIGRSAVTGVLIVLPVAGFALRRLGMSPERRPLEPRR
jgi:hypothetical protein